MVPREIDNSAELFKDLIYLENQLLFYVILSPYLLTEEIECLDKLRIYELFIKDEFSFIVHF